MKATVGLRGAGEQARCPWRHLAGHAPYLNSQALYLRDELADTLRFGKLRVLLAAPRQAVSEWGGERSLSSVVSGRCREPRKEAAV